MLKTIMMSYQDGGWTMAAEPPVTLQDQLILFFNQDESRSCQINFALPDAFGILGLALAPSTGFVLTFRGVATDFSVTDAPEVPTQDSTDRQPLISGTIPPGS